MLTYVACFTGSYIYCISCIVRSFDQAQTEQLFLFRSPCQCHRNITSLGLEERQRCDSTSIVVCQWIINLFSICRTVVIWLNTDWPIYNDSSSPGYLWVEDCIFIISCDCFFHCCRIHKKSSHNWCGALHFPHPIRRGKQMSFERGKFQDQPLYPKTKDTFS